METLDTSLHVPLEVAQTRSDSAPQADSRSASVAAWVETIVAEEVTLQPGGPAEEPEATFAALYAAQDLVEEPSEGGPRSRDGPSDAPSTREGRRKRARPATLTPVHDTIDADARRAFRHSQRALRREARTLNVRDALSRSTLLTPAVGLQADADERANGGAPLAASGERGVFSPTMGSTHSLLSPASPSGASASPWSPALVTDLTRNFLANVERQKRQTVERLLPRDLVAGGSARRVHSPSSRTAAGALQPRRHPQPQPFPASPTTHEAIPRAVYSEASSPASLPKGFGEDVIGEAESQDVEGVLVPTVPRATAAAGLGSLMVAMKPVDGGESAEAMEFEEGELVIGELADPADGSNSNAYMAHASEHSLRLHLMSSQALPDTDGGQSFLTAGEGDGSALARPGLDTDEASRLQALQEQQWKREAEHEEAATRAATRRHEMWRLQQRHLKAQRMLTAEGGGGPQGSGTRAAGAEPSSAPPTTTAAPAPAVSLKGSVDVFEGMMRRLLTGGAATPSPHAVAGGSGGSTPGGLHVGEPGSPTSATARKGSSSIRDVNLSARDLSMIVRLNSFDRTSAQKVVVFGTATSKETKGPTSRS